MGEKVKWVVGNHLRGDRVPGAGFITEPGTRYPDPGTLFPPSATRCKQTLQQKYPPHSRLTQFW